MLYWLHLCACDTEFHFLYIEKLIMLNSKTYDTWKGGESRIVFVHQYVPYLLEH
jgi:hypothetical protein